MTEDIIDYIIINHRWPFSWSDLWDRYFIMAAPLFFILVPIIVVANGMIHPYEFYAKDIFRAIPLFITMLIFGLILAYYSIKRIEKEKLFYSIPFHDKKEKLLYYFENLGWAVTEKSENFITANTSLSLTSWGEIITIVFSDNEILFNSRPHGNANQPFTFNRDKVNLKKFLSII